MSYQNLFYPKSIAIIGASRKIKTVGNDVVKNLVSQGYIGKLFPVNPKAKNLYGLKVLNSIAEIPEQIDLAIIAIPAKFVPQALIEANQKGATAAIIISAGFKEAGNTEIEKEVAKVCQEKNITLIGPNCLGVINAEIKMNASFAGVMPQEGNVAFISQSGALCTAVLDYAQDLHIGFSKFVSTGNKALIDELALLKYFAKDEKTKVIAMYVEQLENAPELINVIKEISLGENAKPVIILKSGTTTEGSTAIASHTGSLAGGDNAYEALFSQAGAVRANSVAELFDYVQMFSKNKLVPVKNVTIVTNAGGPGVLTTDAIINSGLQLSKLEESTTHKLKEFLSKSANTHNPIDILGDAVGETYQKTLDIIIEDTNTDAVIVLLTPQSMTEISKTAHAVVHSHYYGHKPVLASFMGQKSVHIGKRVMQESGVVTMSFPESTAKALGVFAKFVKNSQREQSEVLHFDDVDKQKVSDIFSRAKENGKTSFPEAEALEILKAYNFPMLKSAHAKSASDATKIATEIANNTHTDSNLPLINSPTHSINGSSPTENNLLTNTHPVNYNSPTNNSSTENKLQTESNSLTNTHQVNDNSPTNQQKFAMKIVSQDILHKSDVGGVMLNIKTEDIAEKSQELIARVAKNAPEAKLDGILVMQMAPKNGTEVILGVVKALGLGTMIMVGLGGIYVEILKDVAFSYTPLTKNDAYKMVESLKSAKIFKGVRGSKALDVDALVENIGRLAQLVSDFPEIVELDINPLLVLPKNEGVKVLDARIVIE